MTGKRCWIWVLGLFALAPYATSRRTVTLQVYAAGSLVDVFKTLSYRFQDLYPETHLEINFAASPELRTQIQFGATPDLFASADIRIMEQLMSQKLLAESVIFARNRVCVIVPKENPARIRTFQDLARPGVRIDAGHINLPIGRYMVEILEKMERSGRFGKGFKRKVMANIASTEVNVRHIVAKIVMNDFDAGFVFISDVTPEVRKRVIQILIPDEFNVNALYPIAIVKGAHHPDLARAFIQLLLSSEGRKSLKQHGFLLPEEPVRKKPEP